MPGFVEIIFRTFLAFILLWGFVHQLGKQTIAQKSYHLYIASITIGTIAGNLAFNININFLYFILSFVIIAAVVFILNILALKNLRYRKWIAGDPTTLIEKGQILEESMQGIGFSLDSLKQLLRGKGIFNIEEVEYAILEIDGSLSILKKTEYQTITKRDFHIESPSNIIPVELVIDGKILHQNLSKRYDEEWLLAELKKRNITVSEISYAVVGTTGGLYIDLFQDHL
ncbi:DUF421 domain-containing protein [Bacillus sp. EB600]|uniref:DUF421 domain-containing protein n=1 Tax=Bacillus sp. EB600 TaxID=2806345 RepID=UPI00210B0398|nr:DUF421 domain-containing protein [Bacillus sp. EB600]MCQ6279969.1 DUF421 domain-containing protein [Bacillus sp. EB600]